MTGHSRRDFMNIFGASLAIGGVGLAGCIRKPKEKILPLTVRPENLVPGKPRQYATVGHFGDTVLGLVVESFDGRPTKAEGNPAHPMSLGALSTWAQSSVLDLYDPHRSTRPLFEGKSHAEVAPAKDAHKKANAHGGGHGKKPPLPPLWSDLWAFVKSHFVSAGRVDGLHVLTEQRPSPTYLALLTELEQKLGAKIHVWSAARTGESDAGAKLVGIEDARPLYAVDKAKVIAAFDSDFLGTEGDAIKNSWQFADGRRLTSARDKMNRLYAVEPTFSTTGLMADHRLRVPASQVGEVLAALVAALMKKGAAAPGAEALAGALGSRPAQPGKTPAWVEAVAKDLLANKGASLVVVGERQPARVHALGHLANALLENLGSTVSFAPATQYPKAGSLESLVTAMKAGQVKTLVLLGGNPVYDAPVDFAFGELLKKVPTSLHLSSHVDETSKLCKWHVPRSHALEAWGDLAATDGTLSIQQPLIAPLHDTVSEVELVGRLLGKADPTAYALVRSHWVAAGVTTDTKSWNRALHDGFAKGSAVGGLRPTTSWGALAAAWAAPSPGPTADKLELVFHVDPSVYDGRFATNPWMQELPDTVTKLVWDNAALVSPATAKSLRVKNGDRVDLAVDGRTLNAAVYVTPGVAEHTIVLPLGYGRTAGGAVAEQRGFNASRVRTSKALWIAQGATLQKTGGDYQLVTTQMHHTMIEPLTGKKRPVVRESTLAGWAKDPDWVDKLAVMPKAQVKNYLWQMPNATEGHQWGMSIDLTTCTGCNACTIACQAENNISVVGKERVFQGREMHWIRLDRYFDGDANDPLVVFQPMACQQCETAPCESVCPVAATVHSPEGLNDMSYNRCIGTRYCSNNCPYKVRRFNFFHFSQENDRDMPLLSMQRNPDVTVRFRGVMEKCTYCVQRITRAKITAKRDGDGIIPDGAITPACAQTCPTQSIVFGNINDPKSRVSVIKKQNRDYELLGELNTRPRTTYLAKIRNPNPELT